MPGISYQKTAKHPATKLDQWAADCPLDFHLGEISISPEVPSPTSWWLECRDSQQMVRCCFFFHHRLHPKFTMKFDRLLWWQHPYQNPNRVSIIPNMAIFKRGIYIYINTIPPFSHGDGDSLCWYLPRHPKTWVQAIARHECKWMVESPFDWYTYILIYIHINIHK